MDNIKFKLIIILFTVWILDFACIVIYDLYNNNPIFNIHKLSSLGLFITLFFTYFIIYRYISDAFLKLKISIIDKHTAENKYKSLFENLPDGFALHEIIVDENNTPIDYKFLEVNNSFENLTGLKSKDILNKSILEILPNTENYWIEKYSSVVITKEPISFEEYSSSFDKFYFVRAYSPEPGKFATIFMDITERKKNEIRLKTIANILQYETTSIQEFLDYALNQTIILTNSKYGYIYYYDHIKMEFILNSWSKDVMDDCKVLNPSTRYKLENTGIWGEVVRQRKPLILNNFKEDNPFKKGYPRGHVDLDKFISVPFFKNNEIVAVIGLANSSLDYTDQDIFQVSLIMETIWKVSEKLISENNYKLLFEKEYIKTLELEKSNNELNCLYNITALIQQCEDFDSTINGIIEIVYKFINTKIKISIIINSRTYGFKDISNLCQYISDIKSNDFNYGKIYIWRDNQTFIDSEIRVFDDIVKRLSKLADRKRTLDLKLELENKIYLADRMSLIGILSSNIIHNFNNLIHSLILNISIMQQMINESAIIQDNLKNMEIHIIDMQNIIHQLLSISKGTVSFFPTSIDINEFMIKQIRLFESSRSDLKIEYNNNCEDFTYVYIDINLFSQIFLNLFINSYQAMEDQSNKILKVIINYVFKDYSKLTGLNTNEYIQISIIDNEKSITKENINKIFDPFFTTKKNGSGLGLSTIYSTIKKHHAVIDVNSEENKFTTFNIYLPKSEANLNIKKLNGIDEKVILLIDDDKDAINIIKEMLTSNYIVLDFFDPSKALSEYKINFNKIDLIIVDYKMDIMNGISFIKYCKEINSTGKFILMSGDLKENFNDFLETHLDIVFLSKPISQKILLSTISNLIGFKNENYI